MDPRLAAKFDDAGAVTDWEDRDSAIEAIIEGERPFAGGLGFDADRMRLTATRAFDRTENMAAMQTNHWMLDDGEPTRKHLNEIAVPTLVLHGADDPLFPPAPGETLAREIPAARLVPLPGMGHQYPPEPLWELIVGEITDQARTDDAR